MFIEFDYCCYIILRSECDPLVAVSVVFTCWIHRQWNVIASLLTRLAADNLTKNVNKTHTHTHTHTAIHAQQWRQELIMNAATGV